MVQDLKFIARACSILKSRGQLHEAGRKMLSRCERSLSLKKAASMTEATIINCFQKNINLAAAFDNFIPLLEA